MLVGVELRIVFRGRMLSKSGLFARVAQRTLLSGQRAISASVENDLFVVVRDDDPGKETTLKFPGIWLRDNCQCAECFHSDSLSRKINWAKFNTKVRVRSISSDSDSRRVRIEWDDAHASVFELDWLKERDFSPENRERYLQAWYRPKRIHWGKEDFEKILQRFEFKEVLADDRVLQEWLQALAVKGVAKLVNAPLETDVVRRLANRVGFIRRTTYGDDFVVKSRPGAKNYSYLSEPLPLHTDLPYYEYKPSVSLLHCLVQSKSKGGWNTLTDGFNIADFLRQNHPEHFRTLTQTPVDWNDIAVDDGVPFHNIWRAPVINLDADGNYTRINHSVPQRDNHFSVDIDKVIPWYEANAVFVRVAHEEAVTFKNVPGDVLTFNNLRLLHGRTGYDDTEQNVRHIIGGFIDWDIIYSKMRVLKSSLG